jgi:transposase
MDDSTKQEAAVSSQLNTLHRGIRFKLHDPDARTCSMIRQFAGCWRYVYNKGLEIQKERRDKGLTSLSANDLVNLLPAWKASPETAWLADAPAAALQQGLRNLGEAFSQVPRRGSPGSPGSPGYPGFTGRATETPSGSPPGMPV